MEHIRLNVGGKLREISHYTLEKMGVFEAVFREMQTIPNEIFIDREAELFDEVLAYVAWNIVPTMTEGLYELDHYGVILTSTDEQEDQEIERIKGLTEIFANEIISDENQPFYVNACGDITVTTKARLRKIGYFRGVLNDEMKLKQLFAGTIDDPYRCEIPAKCWHNIMRHLRDERIKLTDVSRSIIDKLGGSSSVLPVVVDPNETTLISLKSAQGALMDLVTFGAADKMLNGDPQATMWKSNYKRMTKASTSRMSLYPRPGTSSNTHEIVVTRCGDLIYQCYIRFRFTLGGKQYDPVKLMQKDPDFLFKLIDNVVIEIGGQQFDRLNGYQLKMIISMSSKQYDSELPLMHLPVFFCSNTEQALPLIALQYHEVKIIVKTNSCSVLPNLTIMPEVLLTYAFLDSNERQSYKNDMQYLIPLYHAPVVFQKNKNTDVIECILNLDHPTRAIFFTLHETMDDLTPLFDAFVGYEFFLENSLRCEADVHICVLDKIDANINIKSPVYVIPFAKEPLNGKQPTMSVNMSKIDVTKLKVITKPQAKFIRVWGNYWNFLLVSSGMGAIRFAT